MHCFTVALVGAFLWLTTTTTTEARLRGPTLEAIEAGEEHITKDHQGQQELTLQSNIAVSDVEGFVPTPTDTNLEEDSHLLDLRQLHQQNNIQEQIQEQIQSQRSLWGQTADIGLIVDGSDQVTNNDFELLKEGLVKAVRHRDVVPLDGSFGIFVVQYGGDNPVVEFPYRRIDSFADVMDLVAAIDRLS